MFSDATSDPSIASSLKFLRRTPWAREKVEGTERGKAAGCLSWPPQQMPDPIGYICALTDPDGNMIEFSYDQGVYEKAQEVWGASADAAG